MAANGQTISGDISSVAHQTNAPNATEKLSSTKPGSKPPRNTTKPRRPNYNQIHSRPLPLLIHPLPAFIPHNPLSLLRIAYIFLCHAFSPPSSHVKPLYRGYFSPETRSVHIVDPATIRALWEQGFFGKGTLSRSEPTWLEAEKTRRGMVAVGTAEENTRRRRQERRKFKEERARKEQEAIEELLRKETSSNPAEEGALNSNEGAVGGTSGNEKQSSGVFHARRTSVDDLELQFPTYSHARIEPSTNSATNTAQTPTNEKQDTPPIIAFTPEADPPPALDEPNSAEEDGQPEIEITFPDQEHLQLTLPEAFFLHYALGVLDLSLPSGLTPTNSNLLALFRQQSYFPPRSPDTLQPDDPFLLSYAVYHHFRSLGWVVRPGLKFSVDYLLYNRGPVFAHAAYSVLIIPAYIDSYWSSTNETMEYVEKKAKATNWHWFHCINRVQAQVLKTLVLAYVEVPGPEHVASNERNHDVGGLLKGYKVREVVVRRWVPQRNLK